MTTHETFDSLPDLARSEAAEYLRLGQSEFTVQELLADEHQASITLEVLAAFQQKPRSPALPCSETLPGDSDSDHEFDYAAQALTEMKRWALDFARDRRADVQMMRTLFNILLRAENLESSRHRQQAQAPQASQPDYDRPFTPEEARAVIRKVEEVFCLCGPDAGPPNPADEEIVKTQ